ncbi:MAG: DUF4352 domain-containing protein [Bacilli bacterium]|nr:DUF4352 domain-containing protein [Bacilli bacterium]
MNEANKNLTKKCQYCQTDIPIKATKCPNCYGKQGNFIQKHPVLFVFLILIGIGMIGGIINSIKKANFQKDYKQLDVVTYEDVKYSITNVEKTEKDTIYSNAPSGYEYVKVTIKIENKSNKKISYNTYNYKMINADGQETSSDVYIGDDSDKQLHSGKLEPDGIVEGYIVWKQKKEDSNLRVRFYDNMFNSEYTFQWTLD